MASFRNFSRYSLFDGDRQHRIDTRYNFPNACLAGLQKRWINSMGFYGSYSLRCSPSWFQHHLYFSWSSISHLEFQLFLPAPFSSARSFQQSHSCVGHFRSFPITYYQLFKLTFCSRSDRSLHSLFLGVRYLQHWT